VLDVHAAHDVCGALREAGGALRPRARAACAAAAVGGVSVEGIAPMWFFRFDDARREERFVAAALDAGVLLQARRVQLRVARPRRRAVARAAAAIEAGSPRSRTPPAHARA
jgi:hypothetical protein